MTATESPAAEVAVTDGGRLAVAPSVDVEPATDEADDDECDVLPLQPAPCCHNHHHHSSAAWPYSKHRENNGNFSPGSYPGICFAGDKREFRHH